MKNRSEATFKITPDLLDNYVEVLKELAHNIETFQDLAPPKRRDITLAIERFIKAEKRLKGKEKKTLKKERRTKRKERSEARKQGQTFNMSKPARRKRDAERIASTCLHQTYIGKTTKIDEKGTKEWLEPLEISKTCYICKEPYRKLHFFYSKLCPDCAIPT